MTVSGSKLTVFREYLLILKITYIMTPIKHNKHTTTKMYKDEEAVDVARCRPAVNFSDMRGWGAVGAKFPC
jgi:hypothetical protein